MNSDFCRDLFLALLVFFALCGFALLIHHFIGD